MRKKIIISVIVLVFIVGIIIMVYMFKTKNAEMQLATNNKNNTTETLKIIPLDDNIENNKMFLISRAEARFITDMSNNEAIAEGADFIVIGTVTSIEGIVNYNPVAEIYTKAQTVGKLNIEKVLKGDIKEKDISFIRLGGIIPVIEYQKSLEKEQIVKRGIDKLTEEEKRTQYVSETMEGDISIEKGKTYLMYLTYDEDYKRYYIIYLQYGLREIDTSTLNFNAKTATLDEYKSIKVKNNTNGEFETLDSIIPKSIKESK